MAWKDGTFTLPLKAVVLINGRFEVGVVEKRSRKKKADYLSFPHHPTMKENEVIAIKWNQISEYLWGTKVVIH